MGEFGLVCNWPDHCEALALLEVANYCRSDPVFLDYICCIARGFLQTLLQVLFWSFTLKIMEKISHYPVELWEVLP